MSHGSDTGRPGEFAGARPPVVPEHTLVRCVGAGSYGQVWLARSVLGSWRAVKVVHRHLFQEDRPYEREFLGVQRFEPLSREDEGFVDILQTGRNDEGGYFYYVMELADDAHTPTGEWNGDVATYEPRTLSRILAEQRRLPLDACIELGWMLCRALGRLHEAGLIHRDVKPSNVIYVAGRPRLADIGLVVEQGEARSWVGTEGFIPPEGPNSPQSDLYSLGKVLYGAATGLDRADFPRLPLHTGSGVDGARFLELNAILLRACAASVQARYATAAAMESDLQLLRSGGSVRQRRRRQFRLRLVAGMVVVTLLVGAVIAVGVASRSIPESGTIASPRANSPASSRSLSAEWTGEGMRRMAGDDPSAALLYFTEALSAATLAGEPTDVLRLRIGVLRDRIPQLVSVIDAGGEIFSVDFGPDGRLVAMADRNGAVTVWDVASGVRVHGPHAPSGYPVRVRIAPDGKRLLLAPEARFPVLQGVDRPTGSARVLDIATGQPLVPDLEGIMWGVFSPDGHWLAAIGRGNRVELRSVGPGSKVRDLGGPTQPVSAMVFAQDGLRLAAVSNDARAWIWSTPEGVLADPPLPIGGSGMLADFSPDGKRLATLAVDAERTWSLRMWDAESRKLATESVGNAHARPVLDLRPMGGTRLLTGDHLGSVLLHDVTRPKAPPVPLRPGKGTCRTWAVSGDGRRAAVGSEDGSVQVWSLSDASPLGAVIRHPQGVQWLALAPDGSHLLAASREGLVRVWKLDGGRGELVPLSMAGSFLKPPSSTTPYPLGVLSTGGGLTFGMRRGGRIVPVWLDPGSGREDRVPIVDGDPECWRISVGHQNPVVAAHPSNGALVDQGNDVLVYRVSPGGNQRLRLAHPKPVLQTCFATDDQSLVTLDVDQTVRRWSTADGTLLRSRMFPGSRVEESSLSSDGQQWCSLDAGKQFLRTFDWEKSSEPARELRIPSWVWGPALPERAAGLARITRHWPVRDWSMVPSAGLPFPGAILESWRAVEVHPATGRVLLQTGAGPVRLLDLAAQTEKPLVHEAGQTPVRSMRFDPSGRFALIVDEDSGVSVFDAATGESVMPRQFCPEGIEWAALTSDGLLAVAVYPNRIRRWPVRPAMELPEKLRAQAEVLSGRRLDGRGQLVWLTGSNLVQRLR